MKAAKLKAADVGGIGLSGQMHGSVFLDKSGNVIRPALLWNDQRTAAECAEIEKLAGGRERLIHMVANPALTGFTAPKILWLRNKEKKNFDKTVQVLLPKDYVRFRMTGDFATEVSTCHRSHHSARAWPYAVAATHRACNGNNTDRTERNYGDTSD